ncbi:MAG: hypothetical protein LBR10_12450 [Prevotellaceae bacterium]|nr:hypothetical protein [Prevotellaceae bacterium]
MDDNLPVYNKATLSKPVNNNARAKISHFIAPLYPKIYLDANEAKKQIYKFVEQKMFFLLPDYDDRIVLRTFLSSSRSYKQYIAHNKEINVDLQHIIVNLELPKFIWIGELSVPELVIDGKVNGLVMLDATEPRFHENKSLMLLTNSTRVAFKENGIFVEEVFGDYKENELDKNEIQIIGVPLQPFKRFESNIKKF